MSYVSLLKRCLTSLSLVLPNVHYQKNSGYCPCCDTATSFVSFDGWLRDSYRCTRCLSIPRERALMLTIEKYRPNWRTLSVHESSPNSSGASKKLRTQCDRYHASQYYPGVPKGASHNGFINQDLGEQTFESGSFDMVITQDVLEHVIDPGRVFEEICRTLKPGGAHIFSVPIVNRHAKSEVRAQQNQDGIIDYLATPEYHLNPADTRGSLVTMHWGFDIVDAIRARTGMSTVIEDLYDPDVGLNARFLEIFVSVKD